MYLIIAYHGKGKQEVDEDLKKLWFNYANFVKHVNVKHMYFFQSAKDDKGAELVMLVEYNCARSCSDTSLKCGIAKQNLDKKCKDVNYWFYVRGASKKVKAKNENRRALK